jgi:hypothetical protein
MVRAKVSAIAAGEAELPAADREGAADSARKHLNLAAASAIAEKGPILVIACGLPGAGKSFVLSELARETAWPCFASDAVRKELAGVASAAKLSAECYTDEFSARTYAELFRRAAQRLPSGPVLLDANFRSVALRARAREVAERAGAGLVILWFEAGEDVIRGRMARREAGEHSVSDADWAVYTKLKAGFEPPGDGEAAIVVKLDGGVGLGENLARILDRLMEWR